MNSQLKTILLTILSLSCFTIALVELSGVSRNAIFNKYKVGGGESEDPGQLELKKYNTFADSVAGLPKTIIRFDTPRVDFGMIKEGDSVNHVFGFTNIGNQPLLIAEALPSCGCTVPSYSKNPILPGRKGEIRVTFYSANQKGKVSKNIIIVSNATESRVSIGFKAEVVNK